MRASKDRKSLSIALETDIQRCTIQLRSFPAVSVALRENAFAAPFLLLSSGYLAVLWIVDDFSEEPAAYKFT
jgi:hypothetical protein